MSIDDMKARPMRKAEEYEAEIDDLRAALETSLAREVEGLKREVDHVRREARLLKACQRTYEDACWCYVCNTYPHADDCSVPLVPR